LTLSHIILANGSEKRSAAVFAFYFAVFAGSAFIREVLFVKLWVLRGSAVPVILLLLAVPSYLVVRKNISILGRYVQIVFFMTMWTMFVYFLTFKEAQFLHLLPVLKEGWKPIFEAVKTLILPFAGFEIILFLYPYLKNKDKAAVGAVIANTLTTVMYLAVSIGAFAFFSPDEITIYHEPEMMMLKVLEFTFVERLEIALFSFYLFTMSSTVLPVIFFTAFCFSKFAGQKKHDKFVILFLVFVLLFVFVYPPTYENIKYMQEFFVKCTLIVSFAFPLLLGGIYVAVQSLENKGGGAMKRLFTATVLILSTVILSSCGYGMPIENLNFPLVLGFDLDEDNHLLFYTSSPVFNKYADEKADIIKVKAKAIRESRKYFDALETGDVTSAKIQIFLIGKKILEHENWFSILDTVYRNPNFSGTTKMVMVDGSVEDVIFHKSKTKPQLSLFLNDLIDNNVKRTRNVKSMAHIFHREMYDKGITPVIPRLVKDKEIKLMGLALLNNKGKYVDKLSIEETSLLLLLRNQKDKELTLSTMLHQVADEGGDFQ